MNLDKNIDPKIKKAIDKLNLTREEALYMLSDIEGYREPLVDINQFIDDPQYLGTILKDEDTGKTKLYSIWIEALNKVFPNPYYSPFYEVAFSGAIGLGKCLCGSTRVPTSLGLLTLEELYQRKQAGDDFFTLTEEGIRKVIAVIDNGIKPVLNISMKSGKVLNPTSEHRFRVLTPEFEIAWKRAGELVIGDALIATKQQSGFGSYKLEPGLAYFMGVLIGDGCFTFNNGKGPRCNVGLCVGHQTFVEESNFIDEITALFHKYVGVANWYNDRDAHHIRKTNHEFSHMMETFESWTPDYLKRVPSVIYQCCQEDVMDFFAGLIDTDGHVGEVIELTFKSESLIDGLNSLCSSMGLITKKVVRRIKGKLYWRLTITGNSSFRRLKELGLKLRISYKQSAIEGFYNRIASRNERTIIPYSQDFIRSLRKTVKLSKNGTKRNMFGAAYQNQNVSLETFKRIEETYGIQDHPTIRYLLDHDAYIETIAGIQPGSEVQTYDLSCDGSPSYKVEGIVTHNSTIGRIILIYDLYKLLMLRNPFSKYGLIASDSIVMALLTANLKLARLVLYKPFSELIKSSPFFFDKLLNKRKVDEGGAVEFPSNVSIQAGSRFTHALGLAVFSGLLDEASFQQEGENTHQAYDSYIAMSRRMKSRFMELGGSIPGHLVLISSKKNENAFLEKHIEENKKDPNFICFDYPLWEAHKDKGIYSGKTFLVFAGTALQSPRILEDPNLVKKYPADKILNVPIEYEKEFRTNPEKALQDLAGANTISSSKYIAFPENLMKAIRIVHCCNVTDHIVLDFFDDKRIIEYIDVQKLQLYLNLLDNSPRYVHIDIGVTDDSYGFAMSCVSGMREVEKFDVDELLADPTSTGVTMKVEPIIRTELALSIRSTTRVPLWKVRDFIVDLSEMGFPIVMITADQYQSEDTLQLMTKMGYETDVVSLDKTKEPHITFRNALYEGRCELPEFQIMIKEFIELVDKGKKFDHTTEGTKDVTDAVVASHYTAFKHSGAFIDAQ
jgi:hypothetical protein